MITFQDAREVVENQHGPTLPTGWQDDASYSVQLVDPEVDDLVNLVDKATATLDRVPYWAIEDRLAAMTPAPEPTPDPAEEAEPVSS